MKKIIIKISFLSVICLASLAFGTSTFGQTVPSVQTNSATNIQGNSAVLNANVTSLGSSASPTVWFQWGVTTAYGNETSQQSQSNTGAFNQNISGLNSNTTYHFRAAAQNRYGIVYGSDMTFTTNSSSSSVTISGTGTLNITKQVINLTSRNLNWQNSVSANPGDLLSFAIIIQPGNQDLHNVVIRDVLPANLIYKGNLTVNASLNPGGNPASGITIATIPVNGIEVISYQAQVSSSAGNSTISNYSTITSNETSAQTATASVSVNNAYISGVSTPTYIPTGLTNNPVKDSFFLPILLIMLGSWLYFSGRIYIFADWLGAKIN